MWLVGLRTMDEEPSSPHEGIFFVLPYLHLFELLSMARVCKSLRDCVKEDIVPGQKLVVDAPIRYRLSDDRLAELAAKSEGRVQVLALINCYNVTDEGLLTFVSSNPQITELHVPNCRLLTPEGLIEVAKRLRLKKLRIDGVFSVKKHHIETLRQLVERSPNHPDLRDESRFFFHHGYSETALTPRTDRAVDLEVCPKCGYARVVFDCPLAACENECRACVGCTGRCTECGGCLAEPEPEPTCCRDPVCTECWLELVPKCSFCNLPYCTRHMDWYGERGTTLLCEDCLWRS